MNTPLVRTSVVQGGVKDYGLERLSAHQLSNVNVCHGACQRVGGSGRLNKLRDECGASIGSCLWYTDVSILLQLLPVLILYLEYRLLEDPLRKVVVVLNNTLREPPG